MTALEEKKAPDRYDSDHLLEVLKRVLHAQRRSPHPVHPVDVSMSHSVKSCNQPRKGTPPSSPSRIV